MGWELAPAHQDRATHSTRDGVMGVRSKESTQGVDNLYKYLINKGIFYGFTKFPLISAICLVVPSKIPNVLSEVALKLSPACKKTLKS